MNFFQPLFVFSQLIYEDDYYVDVIGVFLSAIRKLLQKLKIFLYRIKRFFSLCEEMNF